MAAISNPLLQDPGMVFHPPMLYMGYVGFSVAFAFAIGAFLVHSGVMMSAHAFATDRAERVVPAGRGAVAGRSIRKHERVSEAQ